jgi:hypothetical protein
MHPPATPVIGFDRGSQEHPPQGGAYRNAASRPTRSAERPDPVDVTALITGTVECRHVSNRLAALERGPRRRRGNQQRRRCRHQEHSSLHSYGSGRGQDTRQRSPRVDGWATQMFPVVGVHRQVVNRDGGFSHEVTSPRARRTRGPGCVLSAHTSLDARTAAELASSDDGRRATRWTSDRVMRCEFRPANDA